MGKGTQREDCQISSQSGDGAMSAITVSVAIYVQVRSHI